MGQCMEETSSRTKIHPFLGKLTEEKKDGKPCFKLTLGLSSEDQYIEWSKKINKLRYHCELKEIIYLPLREEFKQPRTVCQGTNFLQLTLQPYDFTLIQTIYHGIEEHKFPTQLSLLRLLIVLVKFINYNIQRCQKSPQFYFQNILLWTEGKVKVLPEELTSLPILKPQYEIELEQLESISSTSQIQENDNMNPIYQAGLMCLCFADLQKPDIYYCQKKREWKKVPEKKVKEGLKKIEGRFSNQLAETLKDMLQTDLKSRITSETLTLRLQTLQNELIQRKQLQSTLGLNLSMVNQLKGSNLYSKPHLNESLLKISNLKFDLTDRASTNMQLQQQVGGLDEVRSLQIL